VPIVPSLGNSYRLRTSNTSTDLDEGLEIISSRTVPLAKRICPNTRRDSDEGLEIVSSRIAPPAERIYPIISRDSAGGPIYNSNRTIFVSVYTAWNNNMQKKEISVLARLVNDPANPNVPQVRYA